MKSLKFYIQSLKMIHFEKALLSDIGQMQALVSPYVEDGTILHRSNDEMATNIRSYILAKEDDKIVGFLALHIHAPDLAEIRSLIIAKAYQNQGIGKKIINEALKEGQSLALKEVLVLTYQWEFFKKLDFIEIPKSSLPDHKIWADCIKCKLFPVCNEVSLIKPLAS